MVICLSWSYVYGSLPQRINWNDYGIERIIGDSSFTTEMVGWSMNIPSHTIVSKLNEDLYYRQPLDEKKKKIVYI